MSLIKPGRWSVNPSLLEPTGQSLSDGLVDLLPFWDDAPTNLASGKMPLGADKYGWTEGLASFQSKTEPTSHGAGWQNDGTADIHISSDRALNNTTELIQDWTHLFVVRVDTNTADVGLHGFAATNQFWLDKTGTNLRVAIQTSAGLLYGAIFHAASDNGTTYVIAYRNDNTNNQTDVWVDGVLHKSVAGVLSTGSPRTLAVGATGSTSKNMNGVIVEFARWNRTLTDAEIQTVSADPFLLLRPALLTTETVAVGQIISIGAATETETAQAVNTFLPFVSCGLPFTLPRVLPTCELVGPITVAIGAATEADVAAAVQANKAVTVTTVTETETPQPVGATKPIIVAITTVTETETAASTAPTKQSTVSPGSETETPQPVSAPKTVSVTPTSETETARLVNAVKDIIITIGATTETEAAQPIAALISNLTSVGVATESEAAWIVAVLKPVIVAVGAATETETAYVVTVVTTAGVIKFVVASVTHPTATATVTHPTATGIVD